MCTVCIKLQTKDLKNVKYNAWHWSICKNRYCRLIQLIQSSRAMACESLVSEVQHPSNQALKQAVTTNCQLSKDIPLHLTIALAAASACTHARSQVCLRKRVQKKKNSMRHRSTYSQRAAGAERYCMLCRQRHFAHMHVHAPHCSRACWPSCGRARKRRPTKNSSHCDRSTDIYSLVAQSCPAAYSCVCVSQ